MGIKTKLIILILSIAEAVLLIQLLVGNSNVALLNSKGLIAAQQRDLMITAILIMLVIIIPVLFFIFFYAWKYREENIVDRHIHEKRHKKRYELLMWIAPTIIIVILSVLNWRSTHALDPYKPIESDTEPLTIQVVALQWKWLFIYPEQGIATVNYIQFPEDTPIKFELTADGPMSSFWIPNLGGQMYAMTGHATTLNLIANEVGEFPGSNAEISGTGFAGMRFIAKATSREEFDMWIESVRGLQSTLDFNRYTDLARPSENTPVTYYASTDDNLYNKIMMKFITSTSQQNSVSHTNTNE